MMPNPDQNPDRHAFRLQLHSVADWSWWSWKLWYTTQAFRCRGVDEEAEEHDAEPSGSQMRLYYVSIRHEKGHTDAVKLN